MGFFNNIGAGPIQFIPGTYYPIGTILKYKFNNEPDDTIFIITDQIRLSGEACTCDNCIFNLNDEDGYSSCTMFDLCENLSCSCCIYAQREDRKSIIYKKL